MKPFTFGTGYIDFMYADLNDLADCIRNIEGLIEQKLANSPSYSEQQFPNTVRNAFFMSCYTQLETYLNVICRNCQLDQNLKISFEDMAQNGIARAMLYFEKALNLELPDKKNWSKIQQYRQLRNIIVHNGGRVEERELKKIKKILGDVSWVHLDTFNHLKLERNFNLEFISLQIEFLREIYIVLNQFTPEYEDEFGGQFD